MEKSGMYYLNLMRRYWFVIVVFTVLTGIATYFFQSRQPSLYQSSVKIFVGNALSAPDPEVSSFESAERLAVTYAELVRSYELLTIAIQDLAPDIDVDELSEDISVDVISDTSIIVINVRYTDAQGAADLANAIANTLIVETPSTLTEEQEVQLARIQGQIDSLEELIDVTNEQHQEAVASLIEPEDYVIAAQLTDQLNSSYGSLALLENEYQDLSNRISSIEVIEAARPDFESLGLSIIVLVVAGSFLGIIFAVSGIVIFDLFDTTLRTEDDISASIDAPILGTITRRRIAPKTLQGLIESGDLLNTEINAQYRATLSNIMFSSSREQLTNENNMFVTVSPQRQNGRTFSVINLAIAAVDLGLKVLLVDADGQNPSLHQYFSLDNDRYALSRLLDYLLFNKNVLREKDKVVELHNRVVREVEQYENLYIIPSGRPATQQKRTIPVLRVLSDFLSIVRKTFEYDLIILDTSANNDSPDAVNLVAVTRSRILLVLEAKGTTEAIASKTAGDFQRLGYDIDGIIMN